MVIIRLVLLGVLLFSLVSCSMKGEQETWIEEISVSGEVGAPPRVSVEGSPSGENGTKITHEGDGGVIENASLLVVEMVSYGWSSDGKLTENLSTYEMDVHGLLSYEDLEGSLAEGEAISNLRNGSRLVSLVSEGGGEESMSEIFVVDVVDSYYPMQTVSGEVVAPGDPDLPVVEQKAGAAPVLKIPATDPPKDLSIVPQIIGSGEKISEGDQVVVQYSGVVWDGALVFDSTWQSNGTPQSFSIGLDMTVPAWEEALVGANVGSRLLVISPPEKAFGGSGNPEIGISPGDTVVYLIDVLGVH